MDDYIDCGTSPALDIAGAITVAAWVNTKDAGDSKHHPYVTKGDHTYALRHRYTAGDPSSTIEFFIYDGTWQSARVPVPAGFNDTWHHLAGTYDGANVNLYIDGTLAATTPHAGLIAQRPELPLYIGTSSESPDRFYQGGIDDVRLYACALDETAINKIKNAAPIATSPVARWTLDGPGSGLTVTVDPMRAAIVAWEAGVPKCWSPAAGGFYRSIRRQ